MIWQFIDSSGVGGAERHVATISASCLKRGVAVRVVLLQDHGFNPWLDQLQAAEVPAQVLDGSFRELFIEMRRQRPHLVHTHGYKAGIFGRAAAKLISIPVVSTFHSGERGQWPVSAYEWLDEWSALASTNIAVSDAVAARLPWPAVVMSSYVDIPAIAPSEGLPPRIVFAGRLSAEKGPDVFCDLAARAPEVLKFDVYGEGPMREELEGRYGNKVRFHGAVADMDGVWGGAGLLVMPSRFEGMPLAALEAMAHGIPVLAAPVGGLRYLVSEGETGWFFNPDDWQEGLRKISLWRAMDATAQSKMRQACRAVVERQFSEQAQFGHLIRAYARAGSDGEILGRLQRSAATNA